MNHTAGKKTLIVLIPTRNRHMCLSATIKAALELRSIVQDVHVRIVISDNSDDKNLISPVVAGLPVDVIYPPSVISMSEHWDWAINNVSADYYALVTDRSLVMAEEFNASLIALHESDSELVSHSFCGYNDYCFPYLLGLLSYTKAVHLLSTADVLKEAKQACYWSAFPRALNCIFTNDLKENIKAAYGAIFAGVAPDFNFGFKVCSTVSSFIFHDVPAFMSIGGNVSNGRSYSTGTAAGNPDFNRMSLAHGGLMTPFPNSRIPINIILHEACSVITDFDFSLSGYEARILESLSKLGAQGLENSLMNLPNSFRQRILVSNRLEITRLFGNLFSYLRFPTIVLSYPVAKSLVRIISIPSHTVDRRFCF